MQLLIARTLLDDRLTDERHQPGALRKLLGDQGILLRNVSRLAKIGFFIWDKIEDKPNYVSEEVAQMHGLTIDEYFARFTSTEKVAANMREDDRQRFLETIEKCRKTG